MNGCYFQILTYFTHSGSGESLSSYLVVPGIWGFSGEGRLPSDLEVLLCPVDLWEAHLKPSGKEWGTPFRIWPATLAVLSSNAEPQLLGPALSSWGRVILRCPQSLPPRNWSQYTPHSPHHSPRGGSLASGPAVLTQAGMFSWEATWPGGRLCRQSREESQSRRLEAGERTEEGHLSCSP